MPIPTLGTGITLIRPRASASASASPAYRSITTMTDQVTASLVVTKPTGTADGDLLFAAIALAADTYTITGTPSGWTALANVAFGGERLVTYYKSASGEGADYTWTFSPTAILSVHMIAIQNIATASPLDVHSEATYTGDTAALATSVTTSVANDMLIGVFGSTGSRTFTKPTTMDERGDTGGGPSIEICTELVVAAGATGTRTATVSSGASGWAHLAAFKAV